MTARPKLKFYAGNLDGTREGGVLAPSWKEAARAIGQSVHSMRQFFNFHAPPEQELKPLTLYTRRFQYGPKRNQEWIEGRCP